MKKFALVLLFCLIAPSLALAAECGLLDLGDDVMLEYKSGAFFDIDGQRVAGAVPANKKVQVSTEAGLISIEKAGSKKSKGKITAIKFSIKPSTGKVIQTLKSGKNQIGLFEGSADNLSFLLINSDSGDVFRASVAASISGKRKIVFKLDEEAFFSLEDCSHEEDDDEEAGEDEE